MSTDKPWVTRRSTKIGVLAFAALIGVFIAAYAQAGSGEKRIIMDTPPESAAPEVDEETALSRHPADEPIVEEEQVADGPVSSALRELVEKVKLDGLEFVSATDYMYEPYPLGELIYNISGGGVLAIGQQELEAGLTLQLTDIAPEGDGYEVLEDGTEVIVRRTPSDSVQVVALHGNLMMNLQASGVPGDPESGSSITEDELRTFTEAIIALL